MEEYGEVLTFMFVCLVLKNSYSDLIVPFAFNGGNKSEIQFTQLVKFLVIK